MRAWWRRRRHRCDRRRAEWIYVEGGAKGRLYCWECKTWLTDPLPLIPLEPSPRCVPAPRDSREAECPCQAARLLNQLIRSLATANGRSTNAERTAWGLPTTGPDTTQVPGPTRIHEGHP